MTVKFTAMLMLILTLLGCGKGENNFGDATWSSKDFTIICLDGVQYYARSVPHKGYLAPRYDKDTKEVAICTYLEMGK